MDGLEDFIVELLMEFLRYSILTKYFVNIFEMFENFQIILMMIKFIHSIFSILHIRSISSGIQENQNKIKSRAGSLGSKKDEK